MGIQTISATSSSRAFPPVAQSTVPTLTAWTRPSDWSALPTVNSGDQKFVGLHAVWNHTSNFVAFTAAGAYTVDWGDGSTAQNIATGVQANHNYVFTDLSSGTLTSGGYRQAIITITPQAGQNLTSLNLYVLHNQSGLTAGIYSTGWLDIKIAGSSLSTLTGGLSAPVLHYMLQQFEYVGSSALTSAQYLFLNAKKLSSIVGTAWTSGITDFSYMFNGCGQLQNIPTLDTSAGTLFNHMFFNCTALQTIPLLVTSAGTTFSNMFSGCTSLQTISLINTAAGTNFSQMFQGCSLLQTIPLINTVAGTNFANMFGSCVSLQTIPLLNTAAGTAFSQMFTGCTSLQTIPLLDVHLNTNFTQMFYNCKALQSVPLLVVTAGTTFNLMFYGCSSLAVGKLSGTAQDISYLDCRLSATELNAIYTGLGTGSGKTITVTGNYGTTGDNIAIATAKSWAVTGS